MRKHPHTSSSPRQKPPAAVALRNGAYGRSSHLAVTASPQGEAGLSHPLHLIKGGILLKNIYREYLYIPKDKHITTKVFTTHVVLSVISVLACTLAMFASSYAWFSMEISSDMNTIAAANYNIRVEWPTSAVAEDEYDYVVGLAKQDLHVFTLYYDGTAEHGFCAVHVDGETYYTEEIGPGTYLKLGIRAANGTTISFQPMWGEPEYFVETDKVKLYGEVYEEEPVMMLFSFRDFEESAAEPEDDYGKAIPGPRTPSKEYQFPQYGTLEDIAAFYEIEVEDILIFNGIEDAEEIEIGDWIDLPYVDEDAENFVPTPPDIEHEVMEGETIESIAALYDISIEELIEYNELEPVEIEEEEPAEEPGAVEPGVPMEQPEWMDEQEEIEEPEEPDINELYPLTPGEILLIPFEITSGYTSSTAVNEKDIPAMEPGTGEFVIIEPGSVLNSDKQQTSDEEDDPYEEGPSYEEEDPSDEEQQPDQSEQSGGILSLGGSVSTEEESGTPTEEEPDSFTEEQPQQGGFLSPVS